MSAGISIPTPEALQAFERWQRAFVAAVERIKARGDWNTCPCELCAARRHQAITDEMPEDWRS